MNDPSKVDWDLYQYLCNLPGASQFIQVDRETMAAIVGFIREFQAAADSPWANDVMLVLKGYLQAISAPSPSPALEFALRESGRTLDRYDAWDGGPWDE